MGRDKVKVNKNAKRTRPILYGLKRELVLAVLMQEIPDGQGRPILPAWIAIQNTEFALSCPLADSAIMIINSIILFLNLTRESN